MEKDVRWLEVDAGVIYWEDGEINGKTDDENTPNMPFTEQNEDGEWRWRKSVMQCPNRCGTLNFEHEVTQVVVGN